jgi:purine-cytosine permease-like protein
MIWWIVILAILTVLSYLTDVGVITFLQNLKVPALNASLLSLLILLCTAGLLIKVLWMKRKGEKERLQQKVQELEAKLK